jgi:hypothetical protein
MGGALNVLLPVRLSRSAAFLFFFTAESFLIRKEGSMFLAVVFVDDFRFSLRSPSQISRGRSGHFFHHFASSFLFATE